MRLKLAGNLADKEYRIVRNADATLAGTMAAGTPVVLQLNGTEDGMSVALPTTMGAAATQGLFYGILPAALEYNVAGEAISNGVCTNAKMTRMTRAASTDSWTSSASIASWAALSVDTINNAMTTVSASAGASRYQAFAILAQSCASSAASASATSDTRTAITNAVKVWVNLL